MGDGLGNIERDQISEAIEDLGELVSQAGGEGDGALDVFKDLASENDSLRQQLEGAVEAARVLGPAWRAGKGDAEVGAALAAVEDALGLREQGGQ